MGNAFLPKLKPFLQPLTWSAGLFVLYFFGNNDVYSLCLFKFMGFTICPGCGIGHAIHEALHFNFNSSFEHHVLGIPATIVLIFFILKSLLPPLKNLINGPETANDASGLTA